MDDCHECGHPKEEHGWDGCGHDGCMCKDDFGGAYVDEEASD